MHKYLSLLFCSLTALVLVSCKPELEFVESSLKPGKADASFQDGNLSIAFPSSAGSATVSLEANRDWSAAFVNSRAKDWCSISTNKGKRGTANIIVTVKENADYDQRSASIIFTCDNIERTIVVTQKQQDALLLTSNRQDVGKDGGTIEVELQANIPYTYAVLESASSWITPANSTKGLVTSAIAFQVAANEEVEKREGAITISSSLGKETVKVYQEGATPTIIVSNNPVEMQHEGGLFQVEIRSNVDVSISIPGSCNWISEVTTKAISTNTYVFEVLENTKIRPRDAVITFQNAKYGLEEELTVIQDGAPDPVTTVDQPGLYGVSGKNYVFGLDGWNLQTRRKEADGSLRYGLLNAGTLSAVTLSGILDQESCEIKFRLTEKGFTYPEIAYSAQLVRTQDKLHWYRANEQVFFVIEY